MNTTKEQYRTVWSHRYQVKKGKRINKSGKSVQNKLFIIFTVLDTMCNTTNNMCHKEQVMLHYNDKCKICDNSQITKYTSIIMHVYRVVRQCILRPEDSQNMTEKYSLPY